MCGAGADIAGGGKGRHVGNVQNGENTILGEMGDKSSNNHVKLGYLSVL